jgi:uncharacterized membrane protein YedE/YeeE
MGILSAVVSGLVFGLGLLVSGMADPGKVIGFLDVAGQWDPSLAVVMAGAHGGGVHAFGVARKRATTFFGDALTLPQRRDIDARLVGGSIVFGIGWGLAGFCPGPALVDLGAGIDKATVFVLAMIAGMLLYVGAERLFGPTRQEVT